MKNKTIKQKDFNETFEKASNNDINALKRLYENYYHYVDEILNYWNDPDTNDLLRFLVEEDLKNRINLYFKKGQNTYINNVLIKIVHYYKRNFKNKADGLAYLLKRYPDNEGLRERLFNYLSFNVINKRLKELDLVDDFYMKLLFKEALNEFIEELIVNREKVKKKPIEEVFYNRLCKIKRYKLTTFCDDNILDEPIEKDLLEQKYLYMIDQVMENYKGLLDKQTLYNLLLERYKYLVDRYINLENKYDFKKYINTNLNNYLFVLNRKGNKEYYKYSKEGQEILKKWSKSFENEDTQIIRNFYFNIISNYVKTGICNNNEITLESYLINEFMKFDINTARLADFIDKDIKKHEKYKVLKINKGNK